ncbi:MAG: hypothetical protein ABJF23_19265 [Bryobacteraceae bacterium]
MTGKHWSDDELLDGLYGVAPADNHLNSCAECAERWQTLAARRRAMIATGDAAAVDLNLLIRQRTAVMDRIEQCGSSFGFWRETVAFACAAAMIVGFAFYQHQHPKAAAVETASSDTQFFSEIYSEVQQTEPRAVKPMRRLFQEHP